MATIDRIAEPWGTRTPYGPGQEWPARVDTHLAENLSVGDVDRWVQSASVLHSNGDAMDIAVKDGRIVGVRGRAGDRVNRGRLGPKDLFGWQANGSPDRLNRPLARQAGDLVECDWDTAMGRIVQRSKQLLAEQGPGRWASTPPVSCSSRSTTPSRCSPGPGSGPTISTATPGCALRRPARR